MRRLAVLAAALTVLFVGCSPATITRIGPRLPPRPEGCDVQVLEEGVPNRPYRDVGMVELSNCEDHREPPCRTWLEEAVCQLGGHVAYLPEEGRTRKDVPDMTVLVMVGAYVADLGSGPEHEAVERALDCGAVEPAPSAETPEKCRE